MTFDFNFNFKEPNGTDIKPEQKGATILSSALAACASKQQVLKIWGWALKLAKPEPLELDAPDQQLLKSLVETSDGMTVLAKAQLLEYIAKQSAEKS